MKLNHMPNITKRFFLICLCNIFILSWSLGASAKTVAVKGPVFTDYGPVHEIKDLTVPLVKDFHYKVLFDISKSPKNSGDLNTYIESIARFINLHVMHGVKLENIDIAVVLHGRATNSGLNHTAYNERYSVQNPTLDLIDKLHAKGVKFYQCGQSAYFKDIKKKDLANNIELALSGMTMLTQLQTEGYQLIPWW